MMFAAGKLLIICLSPLLWIVLVLVYAWMTKNINRRKKALITATVMLLFFSNPFIINKLIVAYQPAKVVLKPGETYSAGIVLGGFSGMNDADQETYFYESSDRFIQTALLYKNGRIKNIVMAGGNANVFKDKTFREADFAREQFLNLSIPDSCVYTDRESINTAENAIYAKKIIDSLQLPPPYLLVTSAIHMPRAMQTFRKHGLDVKAFPAAFETRPSNSFYPDDVLLPSVNALRSWQVYLREVVGRLMYKLTGKG